MAASPPTTTVRRQWPAWLAIATLLAASVYFIGFLAHHAQRFVVASFDTYSYFYPVMLQAADAVYHGGRGLFWNALQDCGQPFVGSGTTGVWYPPFLFALVLPGDQALYALLFFNVAVGALGTYALCREVGLGVAAALAGGLAFGFSNSVVDLITSTPIVSGPYAWMPVAMLCCERIFRDPTVRRAITLGVVLTLALLPGHPQVLVFIYQLLALRIGFEMLTRRPWIGWRTLALMVFALAIPPFLGAGHLLPAIEVMRNSVRSTPLEMKEVENILQLSWPLLQENLLRRQELFNPFLIVPTMLASVALCTVRFRRHTIFYAVVALLTFDLGLGSYGYSFGFYATLPLASLFRAPDRYFWVTAFCTAMLTAIGVDTMLSRDTTTARWAPRAGSIVLPLIVLGALYWWIPNVGMLPGEWLFIALTLAGAIVAACVPSLRTVAAPALALALVANLLVFRRQPLRNFYPNGEATLRANAPVFALLKERMTAQDRLHIIGVTGNATLQQKTGALFGLPALNDYDSLATFRFANYFTKLRTGSELTSLNTFYFPMDYMPHRRRLLDLAAVRYLVVEAALDDTAIAVRNPPLQLVATIGTVRIYENTTALPRARWVSRAEVIPNTSALLNRLITSRDSAQVVRLEALPPPDSWGAPGQGQGAAVTFLRNDPEHVVLSVDAPQRGFVVLADQWFPGWEATRDGTSAEILRADYLFRAVAVPPGHSTIEMRYVPRALYTGMALSAATAIALAMALFVSGRRS